MYDTGLGGHKVNRFFADMNIPGISPNGMSKRESEVSRGIAVARHVPGRGKMASVFGNWYIN